jgi:hypothetical protein
LACARPEASAVKRLKGGRAAGIIAVGVQLAFAAGRCPLRNWRWAARRAAGLCTELGAPAVRAALRGRAWTAAAASGERRAAAASGERRWQRFRNGCECSIGIGRLVAGDRFESIHSRGGDFNSGKPPSRRLRLRVMWDCAGTGAFLPRRIQFESLSAAANLSATVQLVSSCAAAATALPRRARERSRRGRGAASAGSVAPARGSGGADQLRPEHRHGDGLGVCASLRWVAGSADAMRARGCDGLGERGGCGVVLPSARGHAGDH